MDFTWNMITWVFKRWPIAAGSSVVVAVGLTTYSAAFADQAGGGLSNAMIVGIMTISLLVGAAIGLVAWLIEKRLR